MQTTTKQNKTTVMYIFYGLVGLAIIGVIIFLSFSSTSTTTEEPQALGMMRGPLSSAATTEEKKKLLLTTDEDGNLENSNVPVVQIDQNKQELLFLANQNCPTGTIVMWSTNSAPTGWVLCNGQELNKTNALYTRLFDVIGNTYGENGNNFKVPDLKNRFPLGSTPKALNATGGEETHTLTVAEMPSHNHIRKDHDNWKMMNPSSYARWMDSNGGSRSHLYDAGGNRTGDINNIIYPSGGNQSHNNMPPFLVVNFIIKL